MRKILFTQVIIFFLVIPLFSDAQSGAGEEKLQLTQESIDRTQLSFLATLDTVHIDPNVKAYLMRHVTVETDSIQDLIRGETSSPVTDRLLALNSDMYFLQSFQYAISQKQFEQYHMRDMRIKFLMMWDRVRKGQPYDDIMATLGEKRSKMMAQTFREYPEGKRIAELAVIKYGQKIPEAIIQYLNSHENFGLTDSLIFICANRAPNSLVQYMKSAPATAPLKQRIANHPSPLVQTEVRIAPEKEVKTYLPFVVQLMNQTMTTAEIDKLRMTPSKYFQTIVDGEMKNLDDISRGKTVLYRIPTQNYLKQYAVSAFVGGMNYFHEEASEKDRFASLNNLRPEDLYFILVYGGDDFYTSSYLYTYKKLMKMYEKTGSDSLIRYMHYERSRQFIRLAGRYNVLNDFTKMMPRDTLEAAVKRFLAYLEIKADNDLEEVMNVAESFSSVSKDSALSSLMEQEIAYNYKRCENLPNFYGMKLYGVLDEIFKAVKANESGNTTGMSSRLAEYLVLPQKYLHDSLGIVNELVLFYGDKDGESSYASFLTSFRDTSLWRVTKNPNWIEISSKKRAPIRIFANMPLDTNLDLDRKAQDTLRRFLASQGIRPTIIVHRGHSYHLTNSVEYVDEKIRLAILGSCGGYQEIFEVHRRSEDAQVIATKQVGTKMVNEPMIRLLNDYILDDKDINWMQFWATLDKQIKPNKNAYKMFEDYIPPHKNIGMFVARVYHDDED